MSSSATIVPLPRGGREKSPGRIDPYDAARAWTRDFLIAYSLVESYFTFAEHGRAYPFVARNMILPNTGAGALEQTFQNTAFIILTDGEVPRGLNKHFRLRKSNQVSWQNIQRLAPKLDLSNYKADHCIITSPQAGPLLRKLLTMDYAILVENRQDVAAITHMHMKVERLTDGAIRELAKDLGYIDRRLFERGEDYVDALEVKFFEYFGFSAHASGRKSAAAMAAQLLSRYDQRYTVFVANQDDCRLTVLDEGDHITQYILAHLGRDDTARFVEAAKALGTNDVEPYFVLREASGLPVIIMRIEFSRTAAAKPGPRSARDRLLCDPWLAISRRSVIAPQERQRNTPLPPVSFDWA